MTGQESLFSYSFSNGWKYDVFLSFRGEDTRHGFTGHLYRALCERGIHSFIDDEELQRGEQITPSLFKAIQDSRIAIPVFSRNFASSSFCLDELVNILYHIKEKGPLVLSIFYDVDPSDVRRQRGSFGEALAFHEERFKDDKEKVTKWRMALCQAADLSGFDFKYGNESEYEFIERIVKEISSKINRTPLHVADYPVGLESRVLKVLSLLNGFDGVQMVGIHGIGGAGKTTVARAVYNLIADQFEGLCFLDNVRENSVKHGLEHLQETLLYEIIGEKGIKLGSVNKGISIIKHRLHQKKVLLVLDDVDKLEQLRALVGRTEWFGSGSRVIITTRDKHLLTGYGIERTYEVDGFNTKEALELLCLNACNTVRVHPSYLEVLNRAITYASGLPLALVVIGSLLSGKSIKEWESALDRYERIPNKEIRRILKVSFDSLEEDEQKIFLDIACCFKGYALAYVKEILYGHHGFCPEYGIGVLIEKSLIKINEYGQVTCHDLIEQMGKEIARQESPEEPGGRSRLWSSEDVIHVLEENTGSSRIQIIIADLHKFEVLWDGNGFKQMTNLKTLIIRRGCFSNGPRHLPNSLRVLEWRGYPSLSMPFDFYPKKLFKLELAQSCLTSLRLLLVSRKKFVNLKVLNFDDCQITEIPDVSGVPNLEELSFKSCKSLIRIHPSVGFLDKLEILNADSCYKLRSFPPMKLTSLKKLKLSYCGNLQSFPEILGKMENITALEIVYTRIKTLPFSIQNLIRLQRLVLVGCGDVQLPRSILVMQELHELTVGAHTMSLLPKQDEGKSQVSSMVFENTISLCFSECNISDKFLQWDLPMFANVKELDLSRNKFTILPACIKECRFLTKIYLDHCAKLGEIRGIPPNLETFSASYCSSLKDLNLTLLPPSTKECRFLRTLIVDNCWNLRKIKGIPPNIRKLSARGCSSLTSQSRRMLLNEKLHEEGGDKEFHLVGTRIPKWFEHQINGPSISFWFRNKLPMIWLCFVTESSICEDAFFPKVIINGKKYFIRRRRYVPSVSREKALP